MDTRKLFRVDFPITQRNWIYKQHEQEILRLKGNGDRLLQIIKIQETRMNQRKRQKLEPNENDLYWLKQMTENMLRIISLINSYRYFQSKNEPLTLQNHSWFYEIATCNYLDLLKCFNVTLRNRINQKENDSVDFVIVR